jgi:hydroxymethylbilane synthase
MQGKGFFTTELEEELASEKIDLAVHSMKDLQTTLADGLAIGAVCFRGDPRDVVLVRPDSYEETAPLCVRGGRAIGTSSVRRQCQIATIAPSLEIKDLRGNVPTRLRKLRDGLYDAIVLANAGVTRLGLDLSDLKTAVLDPDSFMPAPAQGILAVEIREGDTDINRVVSSIDEPGLRTHVALERGLLAKFEGGCQLPLGAISMIEPRNYSLKAILGIRRGGAWDHLKRSEAHGTDTETVVSEAYRLLTE